MLNENIKRIRKSKGQNDNISSYRQDNMDISNNQRIYILGRE